MMHPLDQFFSVFGFVVAFFGFCCALLCSQTWVLWTAGVGAGMMVIGQGLDKWRTHKHEYKW